MQLRLKNAVKPRQTFWIKIMSDFTIELKNPITTLLIAIGISVVLLINIPDMFVSASQVISDTANTVAVGFEQAIYEQMRTDIYHFTN